MSNSFATPWTVARQSALLMGFPKQEYWGGLAFPSPGIEPRSPALAGGFFTTEPPGKPPSPPFRWQLCCHSGWLTGRGRRPPGGWSGTRPCVTRSTRTGIKHRAAPLLPEVFAGGHTGDLFQPAMNSNLSLTKTVQKTFGKRLRAPALFMRTV